MTLRLAAPPGSVALHGHGLVGQAFAARCLQQGLRLHAVHGSRGLVRGRPGPAAVLVDATPPRYAGPEAEAWITKIEATLRDGTHVVTCNKAPLALAWERLDRAARAAGTTLAASATVGGGTPVLAWVARLRAAHGIARIEATLSGTLSYVLARIQAGSALDAAVREAQSHGYAEPDPALDLDGTDAKAKAVLLHNAAFPGPVLRLGDAGPPLRLSEDQVRGLARPGSEVAALATVARGQVRLGLATVAGRAHAPGTIVARAVLPDSTSVELAGPGAGANATAGALLADLRDVLAGRTTPGVWP